MLAGNSRLLPCQEAASSAPHEMSARGFPETHHVVQRLPGQHQQVVHRLAVKHLTMQKATEYETAASLTVNVIPC